MSPRKSRGWKVWRERSGKNWRARWEGVFGSGQQVFALRDDADALVLQKRRDFQRMAAGLPAEPRITTAVTVGQWWSSYSKTKKRDNPETYRRFDRPALESFVEANNGLALAAVTVDMVKDYKAALEEKYKGDTPRMYYRQVCAFFNAAVREGVLTKSPAAGVTKPKSGGGGGRPLTDAEISFLLTGAPEALYRTAVFSMNTRLRINEVVIFDWAWTWDIEVPRPGGGRPILGMMGKIPEQFLKTRSKEPGDCTFAINDAARAVMGERRESGRVFPFSMSTIQHQLTAQRRATKLPEDITFHCFRHTGASRYLSTEGPDGGHMEDLLKSKQWIDARSLLRYVRPAPETLWRRANAAQIAVTAPTGPLNAKKPPASS